MAATSDVPALRHFRKPRLRPTDFSIVGRFVEVDGLGTIAADESIENTSRDPGRGFRWSRARDPTVGRGARRGRGDADRPERSFVFGYSKLDVMFGRKTADGVRLYYRDIVKAAVEFRQEVVTSIDPVARHVVTSGGTLRRRRAGGRARRRSRPRARRPASSRVATSSTRSTARARLPRRAARRSTRGDVIISVLGPFFKCPAAPVRGRDDAARPARASAASATRRRSR